jgi:DNA-binding protein HU-beta
MILSTQALIKIVADRAFPVTEGRTQEALKESSDKAKKVVEGILAALHSSLVTGEGLRLIGFGSFFVRERKELQGRNPRTGAPITIRACKRIRFRAGKVLKASVNGEEASLPSRASEKKKPKTPQKVSSSKSSLKAKKK